MSTKKIWSKIFHSRKILTVISAFTAVVVITFGCGAWIISEKKEVSLSVNDNEFTVETCSKTVSDLLTEQKIDANDVTASSAALNSLLYEGQEIAVEVTADYKIFVDGKTVKVSSAGKTIGDVLSAGNIVLGDNDEVEPALDSPAVSDTVIDVHRVTIQEEIRETELAYSVEKKKDSTIVSGDNLIVQPGQNGLRKDTYRVTYRDGKVVDEELLSSDVTEPVKEIVAVGTGISVADLPAENNSENETAASVSTAPDSMTSVDVHTMKATAYHEPPGSLTKSGTLSRVGAIAVDPDVIPLGTKLYVEGYGYCVAEDTGGLIKGNRIDIYLDSESECVDWGVRDVTVYVLE